MLREPIRNELKQLYFEAAASVGVVNVTRLAKLFEAKYRLSPDESRELMELIIEIAETKCLPVEFNSIVEPRKDAVASKDAAE